MPFYGTGAILFSRGMLGKALLDSVRGSALRGTVSNARWAVRAASSSFTSCSEIITPSTLVLRKHNLCSGFRKSWSTPAHAQAFSGQASDQQKPAGETSSSQQTTTPTDPAPDKVQETPKTAEIVALEAKITELQARVQQQAEANAKLVEENKELKNRALTALADVENMRVRMNNKAEEDRKFAVRGFAKSMLEVADCLEKALASIPESRRKENAELQQVFEGVEMTDKIFQKGLEAAGIKQFNPLKEKFDPNMHQALFEMPAGEGQEKGVVGNVVKVGYSIHDRVLRPAEVGVTK